MYPERLLDHFRNPRNVGELAPPAVTVVASNPACGDVMKLSARVEAGAVAEARYSVLGCTASIGAGSALTEWLQGKTLEELAAFDQGAIDEALGGLPQASRHAAALCAEAVKLLGQALRSAVRRA